VNLALQILDAVQPIFSATDVIAAHSESWLCRVPLTSPTARSRTSGEYLLFLAIAPIRPILGATGKPGAIHNRAWARRAGIIRRPQKWDSIWRTDGLEGGSEASTLVP
jgi:hypothetical protein